MLKRLHFIYNRILILSLSVLLQDNIKNLIYNNNFNNIVFIFRKHQKTLSSAEIRLLSLTSLLAGRGRPTIPAHGYVPLSTEAQAASHARLASSRTALACCAGTYIPGRRDSI